MIAIGQDNLSLTAVLHTLDERHKRLTPHINDNEAEEIISLSDGTRHRKDGILLIRRIAVRRQKNPILLLIGLPDQSPMQIRRQTIVMRQIIRRNDAASVCRKEIDCRLTGTPRQNCIQIAIDMLHICPRAPEKRTDLPPCKKR